MRPARLSVVVDVTIPAITVAARVHAGDAASITAPFRVDGPAFPADVVAVCLRLEEFLAFRVHAFLVRLLFFVDHPGFHPVVERIVIWMVGLTHFHRSFRVEY